MKKIQCLVTIFVVQILSISATFAQTSYSTGDVSSHDSPSDCYVIFEEEVYDITSYLEKHEDRFMPIEEWCGKDMTEDFKNKAGAGRDHTGGYNVLEEYKIGDLEGATKNESSNNTSVVYGIVAAGIVTFIILVVITLKRNNSKPS